MKIAKKDALAWFEFFAQLPDGETLMTKQQEIVYATLAQLEAVVVQRHKQSQAKIPQLKTLKNRTFYVGPDEKFPQGCRSCLLGSGLTAIRKTNKCNLQCKFCYDYDDWNNCEPVGEGLWVIGGTKFYERDLDLLLEIYPKPTGVAYVYLEPFMEIEKYYNIIRKFHDAGIYQHLYTNGTLANEANLKALGAAGLNELRFNLGASNCADAVIANIALAKHYIPRVGIETPMTPEFFAAFTQKKEQILATQVDFMNCAELHLNPNNIVNYWGEELYATRLGYISPIWSREFTFRLQTQAVQELWDLVVHDCSNETKFARDLNQGVREGKWFGASSYASEFTQIPYEVFLPILQDDEIRFLEEEELPAGYKPGEMLY